MSGSILSRSFMIAVRVATFLVVFGLLFYIVNRAIVPSGMLSVTSDFITPVPFVSELKPSERLRESGDGEVQRVMVAHPLYVDVTPPSQFNDITLVLRYLNNGGQLVELGALASSVEQQFSMVPAEHPLLDTISWSSVVSGNYVLFQRSPEYASVDAFLRNPPPSNQVAVYRADTPVMSKVHPYVRLRSPRTTRVSLRGHHRMWTYIKNETLQFTFAVQDMNRQEGADPVILSVYAREDSENVLARTILQDDGNTSNDQRSSGLRTLSLSVSDLPEGAYQLEFTAPADIFIREITTMQRKLVFEDKLNLGDHVGYSDEMSPLMFVTNGSRIVARTAHAEALQTIMIRDGKRGIDRINVDEVHTRFVGTYPVRGGLREVTVPKRDILMETDGVFSFSEDEFFNPLPFRIQWYTRMGDIDTLGINYILTSYEPPRRDGEFRIAEATFSTDALARTEDGAYRFVLASPGIARDGRELGLASLTVIMQRDPVTAKNIIDSIRSLFIPESSAPQPVVAPTGATYGEVFP